MVDDKMLLKHIDGELDEQATAEVVEQLKRDPALQRHLAELRAVEAAYHVSLHAEDLPTKQRESSGNACAASRPRRATICCAARICKRSPWCAAPCRWSSASTSTCAPTAAAPSRP
jgi:anti-sigma factor RsiW